MRARTQLCHELRKTFCEKMEEVHVLNSMMEGVFRLEVRERLGEEQPSPREDMEKTENILMLNLKRTVMSEIVTGKTAISSVLVPQRKEFK